MYSTIALSLAALLILNSSIATPAGDDKNGLNAISLRKSVLNENDTILEIFNSCRCIAYYQCSETNKYLVAARLNILKKPMQCSKKTLVCCNVIPEEPVATTTTTESPAESKVTTLAPTEVKHVVYQVDKGCGIPKTDITTRILTDGVEIENTIPGEHPWIVAIFQKNKQSNTYRFKCAGTLVHPKVVLTATHCVLSAKANLLKVVATGKEVFQSSGNADEERSVEKIIKHEKYYSGGLYNDIALLVLSSEIDYSKTRSNSICLPPKNYKFSGQKCLAVGWGYNPSLKALPLKKVDVPIVDNKRCETLLQNTRLGKDFELHSSFMCAGGEAGKDTCKGDGGGPLICLGEDYTYVQAGIISWGVELDKCGKVDQPGVYTDVSQFSEWISNKLNESNIFINEKTT